VEVLVRYMTDKQLIELRRKAAAEIQRRLDAEVQRHGLLAAYIEAFILEMIPKEGDQVLHADIQTELVARGVDPRDIASVRLQMLIKDGRCVEEYEKGLRRIAPKKKS